MDISFEFINQTTTDVFEYQPLLLSLIEETLALLEIKEDVELSLVIVDNKEIQTINHTYRNIDRPTDVISFALEDEPMVIEKGMPRVLGDIFISIDKAKQQAEEYQHSLKRELSFLFVHGLLHLLGYDHMTKQEEEVMFQLQKQILDAKGIDR